MVYKCKPEGSLLLEISAGEMLGRIEVYTHELVFSAEGVLFYKTHETIRNDLGPVLT